MGTFFGFIFSLSLSFLLLFPLLGKAGVMIRPDKNTLFGWWGGGGGLGGGAETITILNFGVFF